MERINLLVPLSPKLRQLVFENFDALFYKTENYDLDLSDSDLFDHFLTVGFHEGRSPNPFFDVSEYLSANKDVLRAGLNPLVHYWLHGRQEGRAISQTIRLKQRLAILGDGVDIDWISLSEASLDKDYYRNQISILFPELIGRELNYSIHYALLGWKLGLDPNPSSDTKRWIASHPHLEILKLAPLLIQEIGGVNLSDLHEAEEDIPDSVTFEADEAAPPSGLPIEPEVMVSDPPNSSDDPQEYKDENGFIASNFFDPDYYLATYNDVRDAKVDPLYHYANAGWREGRNPSANFSTSFYLSTYQEVAQAGIDPLSHYLLKGRSLGYMTKPPGGWKIEVLEQSTPPAIKEKDYPGYKTKPVSIEQLKNAISGKSTGKKTKTPAKLMLAISHDSYSTVTGGTQIFIADEMVNANNRGISHLHLAPAKPGLTIGRTGKPTEVLITINGKILGIMESKKVFRILGELKGFEIILSIHSLMGFGAEFMQSIKPIAKNNKNVMWLHDYSLVCDGYNLLRNDTMFCGAPPPTSISCEVCVYGRQRAERLKQLESWIRHVKPVLASPSIAALNVMEGTEISLPFSQRLVAPHWSLKPAALRKRQKGASMLRIAFVGYSAASKGWPVFDEVVNTLSQNDNLEFYHFIKGGASPNSHLQAVDCAVSSKERYATANLLMKHKIDAVMVLSPWPETFSYVAAETLIAGCTIVCLESSGNVQALARQYKQGLVYKNDDALMTSIKEKKFITLLKAAIKSNRFHEMKQNNGIFDVLPVIS